MDLTLKNPLWQSMGVLNEAPSHEVGLSAHNQLTVMEKRLDEIIGRIIGKISKQIDQAETIDMDDSKGFPRIHPGNPSELKDKLSGDHPVKEKKIAVLSDLTSEDKEKSSRLEYRSQPFSEPTIPTVKSVNFELMPLFLDLATAMVNRITHLRFFNGGEPIESDYPKEFFNEIQKWGEEYCFLFILAIGCEQLPLKSSLTFYSKFILLGNFANFLDKQDLIVFCARQFQKLSNAYDLGFKQNNFIGNSYLTFLINPIAWRSEVTLLDQKSIASCFKFAFEEESQLQAAKDYREIKAIHAQLYSFSQQPREIEAKRDMKLGVIPGHITFLAKKLQKLQELPHGLESLCRYNLNYFKSELSNYDEWNTLYMYALVFMPNLLQYKSNFDDKTYGSPSFKTLKKVTNECVKEFQKNFPDTEARRRSVLLYKLLQHTHSADPRENQTHQDILQFFIEFSLRMKFYKPHSGYSV